MHLGSVDTKIVGKVGEEFHASAATWPRLDLQTCTGVSRCREREAKLSGDEETKLESNREMDEMEDCGCRDGGADLPMANIMTCNATPLWGTVCPRNPILGEDR